MERTKRVTYSELRAGGAAYYGLLAALGLIIAAALASAWRMEHFGHVITGMSNQIVWGMPHVFAVFLIVAASGALNIASLGTVFGRSAYKPLGRLSGLLAIALLLGGLVPMALMLRPGAPPSRRSIVTASALVILGGMAQIYVIIIGGQAYPLELFPGMEVRSSFYDGVVASYAPSPPEFGLGLGGMALAAAIVVIGPRIPRFLPNDLADPAKP